MADQVMVDPLMLMSAWVKPIDTTHPLLRTLADYQRSLIAPFVVSAAQMKEKPTRQITGPTSLDEIPGLNPLLKFRSTFTDEHTIEKGSTAAIEIAYRLMNGQVDIEVLQPKLVGLVRSSIS